MLIAAIGALWVFTIVSAVLLIGYFGKHLQTPDAASLASKNAAGEHFVWDAPRFLIALFLSLAAFYAGMARTVAQLPAVVAFRLSVQPATVWPVDIWLGAAFACFVCAAIASIWGVDWPDELASTRWYIRKWRRTTRQTLNINRRSEQRRPMHLTPIPRFKEQPLSSQPLQSDGQPPSRLPWPPKRRAQLEGPTLQFPSIWPIGRSDYGFSLRQTIAAVLLISVLGMLFYTFVQMNPLGGLREIASFDAMLPSERSTPTPTPLISGWSLAVVAADDSPTREPAENAPQPQVSSEESSPPTPTLISTLPAAATALPTPTPTSTAYVEVTNLAGVNARSAPDGSSEVQTVLLPGSSAPIIREETSGDWIAIRLDNGSEAWVSQTVVNLSRPLNVQSAPVAASETDSTHADVQSEPVVDSESVALARPTATPRRTSEPAENRVVVSSSVSANNVSSTVDRPTTGQSRYSVDLLDPSMTVLSSESITVRWASGFRPSSDQGFEVVIWQEGESPLEDGASLGAPSQDSKLLVDLSQRGIQPGEYKLGVLLVQTSPYRRLAHLSGTSELSVR